MRKFWNQGEVIPTACAIALLLSAGAHAAVFPEAEPNDSKATANPVFGIAPGDQIIGNSISGTGTGLDYFRLRTVPQPLGIYQYTLVITTAGTAGHTGTIRGLAQSAGVINPATDNTFQTSSTTTSPARANRWYGFGKQEEIFYRVAGVAATTQNYVSSLSMVPVNPVPLGSFQPGNITISTVGQTTPQTDTDMWVYDGALNAIPTYGNDDEFGTSSLGSRLTRNYGPGVYYLALTNFGFANDQPSPADDDFRTGTVMDFPNSGCNSSTTAPVPLNFQIIHSGGTSNFTATKGAFFEVYWATFTVAPPSTAACCQSNGSCANLDPLVCEGEAGPIGSSCAGDANGNGIDEYCEDQPCEDAGPGPHWIDTAPPGSDIFPTGALVGIDTDLDCVRDQNLVLFGPAGVSRGGSLDDSGQYPGTRPIDGHSDVIDTEMRSLTLSGGGVTLTAGAGLGAIPLTATLGNIAEQPGDPNLADSFFDVFFEVDLGGGNRLYNQVPLRAGSVIGCVPPNDLYFHPTGICIPLYTSPIPGLGVHVANLVSARHDPFPQPGACCRPDGGCIVTDSLNCAAQDGAFQGEGSTCPGSAGTPVVLVASPNVAIPDNSPAGVSDTIDVADTFQVADLDVDVVINHTWIGDLTIRLSHGTTQVVLWDRGCGNFDNMNVVISDEGAVTICASPTVGTIRPTGTAPGQLSAFDGQSASGPWTLTVTDAATSDLGTLVQWSLHLDPPAPSPCALEACCARTGGCSNLRPADCLAAGGEPGGPGSACAGDANGNGIDDTCEDQPCDDCGPGPHWIHAPAPCPAGVNYIPTTATVGVDTNLDGISDTNLNLAGPTTVQHAVASDDSGNYPGLAPVDGHIDVIDYEMTYLSLTGGGASIIAGSGLGALPLAPSLGAMREQVGNPALADGFFDVFFELDLGGGNKLYNQTPLRINAPNLDCFAPILLGLSQPGILPLFTSPTGGVQVANLVNATHTTFPQPGACCLPNGQCIITTSADCAQQRGEFQGVGSVCLGDLNGDGIDDLCADQPCDDGGPGPHWVDAAPAGNDIFPTGALVGIDTNLDCVRDQNLVMFGPAGVTRTGSLDDSGQYPGTRPIDGHQDVIDTEMVSLTLSGGGVTLTAGAGLGAVPLAATRGNIAEQPGDPTLADSFFDVFFEIDLGGGNRLYNQTPLRAGSTINCVPPNDLYFHPTGICIPLYTSPFPGLGVHVANLVSARHDPFPQPGACCLPGGTSCISTNSLDCGGLGGQFQGEGSSCDPNPCLAPPEACCLPNGTCVMLPPTLCAAQSGESGGPGSVCAGDGNGNGIDDFCEDQPCDDCGPGPHWIHAPAPCPAGVSFIPTTATVGVDTNLDGISDTNLNLAGPTTVQHAVASDDSANYPGLAPVDGHIDVIDYEMTYLSLTGGGASIIAGSGLGALPLAASLGAMREQAGNPSLADGFFDVFFELDLGGGTKLYNQTPLRINAPNLDCFAPILLGLSQPGILPLFTSPTGGVQVANLVNATHSTFPQPGACCLPNGQCIITNAGTCAAQRGEFQGVGSACLGDLDGDGVDDLCQDQPCEDGGPGPHWVDATPAGNDIFPTGALVGIDTNLDCVRDQNLVMFGPAGVSRTGSLDDSGQYPGTRPIDTHLDVIDTEMLSLSLSGGGATLIAGAGLGVIPLAATLGNIAEQPGNPLLADSFFDVFFEVDLGGGNRLYNQTPLRAGSVINCVPPNDLYFHPTGICIPLYTSPIPGQGVHVANLVSARHDPFPQSGACCLPGGACVSVTGLECEAQGGQFQGEGSGCDPNPCGCPTLLGAVSRKCSPACDLPNEPRQGGISQVVFNYNAPAAGVPNPTVEADCTCPPPPNFLPIPATPTCTPLGNQLICTFAPPLSSPCTYRFRACSGTGTATVVMRSLVGDVNGDGRTDAIDRSVTVGAWTGPGGYTCQTDVNCSGRTDAIDRSVVVGSWTSGSNCVP